MEFSIIVKGSLDQASKACSRHDTYIKRIHAEGDNVTTLIVVSNHRELASWFVEQTGAPFPAGTLLHY